MIYPHAFNTENPDAVANALDECLGLSTNSSGHLITIAVADVAGMFRGLYPGYQAIDMEYHDLDHTFQVTLCMANLLRGRAKTSDEPVLDSREQVLALLAALLHDTGFLKEIGDNSGTGAKYTFEHEKRSCVFARKYLPSLDVSIQEIEDICSAIMCTGPRNRISNVIFQREDARQIALLLVTADYLAQMSAPDYVEKLPRLYHEFMEAFDRAGTPLQDRPYKSLLQLLEMTSGFWEKFVLPILNVETEGAYHYLADEEGVNPYLDSVQINLEKIQSQLTSGVA
jgi:hypothetical protein